MKNFKILDKTDKLVLYSNQYIIGGIPKNFSVYKDELIKSQFSLRKNIVLANINIGNSYREKYQKDALADISMIDFLMVTLKNCEYVDNRRFFAFVGLLNDIRAMVIGWKNSEKKEN